MNYISKNLRFLRKRANLTQEQFAHKVNMNRGNIASYEKGSAEPSVEKLQRIASYFKLDLNYFIERDLESLHKERDDHLSFQIHSEPSSTFSPGQYINGNEQSFKLMSEEEQEAHLQQMLQNNLEISHFQITSVQGMRKTLEKILEELDALKSLVREVRQVKREST